MAFFSLIAICAGGGGSPDRSSLHCGPQQYGKGGGLRWWASRGQEEVSPSVPPLSSCGGEGALSSLTIIFVLLCVSSCFSQPLAQFIILGLHFLQVLQVGLEQADVGHDLAAEVGASTPCLRG